MPYRKKNIRHKRSCCGHLGKSATIAQDFRARKRTDLVCPFQLKNSILFITPQSLSHLMILITGWRFPVFVSLLMQVRLTYLKTSIIPSLLFSLSSFHLFFSLDSMTSLDFGFQLCFSPLLGNIIFLHVRFHIAQIFPLIFFESENL